MMFKTGLSLFEICKIIEQNIDKNGQSVDWHQMNAWSTCPFCGAGYLQDEFRSSIQCLYCRGSYELAHEYSLAFNSMLNLHFELLPKTVRQRLAELCNNSYYGFEIRRRNRAIDKNDV